MDVGKTSLMNMYVSPDQPVGLEKIKTVGVDIRSAYVKVFDSTTTKVRIWDTAG